MNRRRFLLAPAALAACRPQLAKPIDGYLYVACQAARAISVVSLSRFRLSKEIGLDAEPTSVLVKPGTQRVFALTPATGTIIELEGGTATLVRKYRLAAHAISMRLAPDGASLWLLAREPQALIQLDLASGRVTKTIALPGQAADFDLNANVPFAVLDTQPALINLVKGTLERPLNIDPAPELIRFRPDGKQVLAAYPSARQIAVSDVATGRLLVKLPLPLAPRRFCFTHDNGGQLFVSGPGVDAVVIVSPYQTVVSETVLAGRAPGAMAIDRDDRFVFVANPDTGDLTVITIADRLVVAKIPVGQQPGQILITDDGQYVLVLNRASSDLAVIRLSKLTGSRSLDDTRSRRAPLFTVVPLAADPVSAALCA